MIKQHEHCSNIGKSEIVTDLQASCGPNFLMSTSLP